MAAYVKMPQKGLSEESAILSKWYVKEGDSVKTGDYLFAIETGKATFDVESESDGTVLKTIGEEGDEIAVKKVVVVLGTPGESFEIEEEGEQKPAEAAAPAANEAPAPAAAPAAVAEAAPLSNDGFVKISPRARTMADNKGVDIRALSGSGPDGRIIERDVAAAALTGPFITDAARPFATGMEQGTGLSGAVTTADIGRTALAVAVPAAASIPGDGFEVVPNSRVRKIIAANMKNSLGSMAQLTNCSSFDATAIMAMRETFKKEGEKFGLASVTINDMIIYAVARTVLEFPYLNAHYSDDEMKIFKNAHIGVAVDTERGLMVPTIANANLLSLSAISAEMKVLARQCQEGTVDPAKLSGATFTISNLGNMGITTFTPIINPPQTGILGVGGIEYKVRMVNGAPAFYPAMNLSLTYDHRAVDGAPASRFLMGLARNLENFQLLLAK